MNPDALLGAYEDRVARIEANHFLDLLANPFRFRRRQVDLIDYRNDFEIMMQRQVGVRQRLRFHSLRRVHHQQRAFARLQAA